MFYLEFQQSFSRIAALLIFILKTIKLLDLALKVFEINDNKTVGVGSRAHEIFKNLSKSKKLKNEKSKNLMYIPNIETIRKPIFLISNTQKIFNSLKQAFIKAPIFQHFNQKYYIQIKKNALSYVIS